MRWREALVPRAMTRVAVVARTSALRDALVRVADAGTVEIDRVVSSADQPISPLSRARPALTGRTEVTPALAPEPPDIDELARAGRADLLAGEAQLADVSAQAVVDGEVAAVVGWVPTDRLPDLAARLAPVGAAAVPLPRPRGVEPPTAAAPTPARRAFGPIVDTYGTIPYADVDPTILAGIAYAVMFGAMFGDVGHGALLVVLALLIRAAGTGARDRPEASPSGSAAGRAGTEARHGRGAPSSETSDAGGVDAGLGSGRSRWLARLRPHWSLVATAGLMAMVFGVVYGEAFGPTGLVPPGLIEPLQEPVRMLGLGVGIGAVLLAGAYVLAIVNRLREGGWALALYAPAGVAGALVFLAAGLGAGAAYWRNGWAALASAVLAATGVTLAFVGLLAHAGGRITGVLQALVETVDLVIRLGANIVSFARLAAFGLTHAVLTLITWQATTGLWASGAAGKVAAVLVVVVGNALAFGLEALVAGIQALRLEYYELFSRVFQAEGRPFRPWHVPTAALDR